MTPVLAHVGGGSFEPIQVAALTLVATAYALRAMTLSREGRPLPGWRIGCFAGGLALIAAALTSPLANLAGELFLAHMTQHLLMADVGALLLVLGLTGPLLQPLLAISWLGWMRRLAHPLVALPLWTLNLYLWHLPVLYQATLTSDAVHALQHTSFVGFGVLMWMPLVGPLPVPSWFGAVAKIGYVVAVRFAGTILGNVFMWAGEPLYPDYGRTVGAWDLSALTDQGTAGVIMTIEGGLMTLGVLAWLFLRWAQQDTERQELLDLADRQGVTLSEQRAERAAHAGRAGRLAERIRKG